MLCYTYTNTTGDEQKRKYIMSDLRNLLIESSSIMAQESKKCFTDFAAFNSTNNTSTSESSCCDWYHAAWQYLRVLDCVSAPQWHEEFYETAFKDIIRKNKGNINILVTGTADYSILHILVPILLKESRQSTIDIIDLCNTPLKICSWYVDNCYKTGLNAQQIINVDEKEKNKFPHSKNLNNKINFNFTNCNVSFYNTEKKYDIICSDAFLTRFDKKEVKSITDKWRSLLKQDGRVVTTVRIHDANSSDIKDNVITMSKKINRFCTKVVLEYEKLEKQEKECLNVKSEDLRFMAFRYIERMKSNNLGNEDEINKLFMNSNLEIINKESSIDTVKGEISETKYYRIVAKKA